jgi:hypothetical protein
MEELLEMSKAELERVKILNEVLEGRLTQVVAAKRLKISDRQVRNLLNRMRRDSLNLDRDLNLILSYKD